MMGKVIEFGRRDQFKPPEGFWRQEYLLFPSVYHSDIDDLPFDHTIPAGAEITLHPGNAAHLLVNEQLLRVLALSPRELREAVFVTPQKILRFKYAYGCLNNNLSFINFLKKISFYVDTLQTVVLDNLGMCCWFPEQWLEIIDRSQFDLRNHLTIHTIPERKPNRYWIHTHGMVQFACPDLEVRMVSQEGRRPTLQLMSRLIHYQFQNGPVFKEGCRVAIAKGWCWATFKHYRELSCENHYQNNYFRVLIGIKK